MSNTSFCVLLLTGSYGQHQVCVQVFCPPACRLRGRPVPWCGPHHTTWEARADALVTAISPAHLGGDLHDFLSVPVQWHPLTARNSPEMRPAVPQRPPQNRDPAVHHQCPALISPSSLTASPLFMHPRTGPRLTTSLKCLSQGLLSGKPKARQQLSLGRLPGSPRLESVAGPPRTPTLLALSAPGLAPWAPPPWALLGN